MTISQSHKSIGLLGDFRILLMLLVSFRLMMLMVYQPILLEDGQERGVGAGGDRQYHYALAELTSEGDYPFLDWWSEFPPVWYTLTTLVYRYQGERVSYEGWSMLLGLVVIAFDVGNLILMRKIGTHVYGEITGLSLAWVYAVTIAPLVFIFWNFETLVAFFLLLGLWFMLKKQHDRSAAVVVLGALTKFTPALLLGALIRFRSRPVIIRYIVIVLVLFCAVYAVLYLNALANDADPDMVTVSLTAQFGKASYQTIWALLDQNYTTGNFGTIQSHYDPAAANTLYGNEAVIPGFIRLAIAAAVGLFVFVQTRRFDDRGLLAFVTITLLIFFLQAQGWSPQWLTQIVPLILLSFPTRNGVLTTIILSLAVFTEYPVLFIRTGDTGGVITGAMMTPFVILILSRTLLLVGVCFGLYQILRQESTEFEQV